ncbi:MAG: SprT family zinc-dependent metalloprotease [Sulfurimonas sp.]
MSTNKINFNDLEILHLQKTTLKHSYISVKKNGEIVLKTPKVSNTFIQKLLTQRESWIRKQLKIINSSKSLSVNLQDEILLFGEVFSIDTDEAIELRDSLTKVYTSNQEAILKCYDKFYKNFASSYLTQRVEHYAEVMKLSFSEIKFKKMRSRWGSCSSRGVITLNIELIKIDKKIIDFIVVHELSHLVHMNHSKKFHSLVCEYIPEAKALNKELRAICLL